MKLSTVLFFYNLTWLLLLALAGLTLPSVPAEGLDLAAEISGAPAAIERIKRFARSRSTRNSRRRAPSPRPSRATSASAAAAAGPIGG